MKTPSKKGQTRKKKGMNARQQRDKTRPRKRETKLPDQNNMHEQRSSEGRGQEHDKRNGRVEIEPTEKETSASPWKKRASMTNALLKKMLHLQRNMKYEYEWMNIHFTLDEH